MGNNKNKKGSPEQSDSSDEIEYEKILEELNKMNDELESDQDTISASSSNSNFNNKKSGNQNNTIWNANLSSGSKNNSMGVWATLGAIDDHEDFKDIFIKITAHLSEEDVSKMLSEIKAANYMMYKLCLYNLISFPNFRLMSEKFLIETFEDYQDRLERLNFEMVYGKILDDMPGLRLLLKI
jgi:hypothetical protein